MTRLRRFAVVCVLLLAASTAYGFGETPPGANVPDRPSASPSTSLPPATAPPVVQPPSASPSPAHPSQTAPPTGRRGTLRAALQLTPSQERALQPIVRDFRQRGEAIEAAFQTKLQTVLTPQQQQQFRQIVQRAEQEGASQTHDLVAELHLTPQQVTELKQFHQLQEPKMRAAVQEFVARLKAILTPGQQATFDRYILERQQATGRE